MEEGLAVMKKKYLRISSKGAITIPAELRRVMKLTSRTKIAVDREGQILVLRPITEAFIDSLCGCTKGAGQYRESTHRDDTLR